MFTIVRSKFHRFIYLNPLTHLQTLEIHCKIFCISGQIVDTIKGAPDDVISFYPIF